MQLDFRFVQVTFLHKMDRICVEKGHFYLFFSLFLYYNCTEKGGS